MCYCGDTRSLSRIGTPEPAHGSPGCASRVPGRRGTANPLVRRILRGRRSPAATRRPSDASFGHGGARRTPGPDRTISRTVRPLAGLRVLDFGVGGVGVEGGRLLRRVRRRRHQGGESDLPRFHARHQRTRSQSFLLVVEPEQASIRGQPEHPDGLDLVYELVAAAT